MIDAARSRVWAWIVAFAVAPAFTSLARAELCLEGGTDCSDCQNHVQPFSDEVGYVAAMKKVLLGDTEPEAYIIWATFTMGETAVSLRKDGALWRVRASSVDEPIWRWKDLPDGDSVLDFHTDQPVAAAERELPGDLAREVIDSWHSVLLRTRAQPKSTLAMDGTVYTFHAGDLDAEDANLDCGVGVLMLQIGVSMWKYARADPISRWSLRTRTRRLIARIARDDYPKE